ncbi:helix-turn-helix domain-containing protein [Streptomyces sp. NPDC002667]|uniref:helix-turn-helix domain-containing protein n=1 Tax=Streptomyces sp. NPDC002667 TaxID=3364657 RepID=UPI00369B0E3E
MPNRRRAVDPTHPLGGFAQQLRQLQVRAMARAESSEALRAISVDTMAGKKDPWPCTRSAIYAALNGTRLPSPYTLCAIVTAWDPRGQEAIAEWLKVRDRVEEDLIRLRSAELPASPADGGASASGLVEPPANSSREYNEEALQELVWLLGTAAAKRDLSMQQIAVRAGLGRTTVSQAFSGRVVPSERTTAVLAHTLGLPVEDVLRKRMAALLP